MGQFPTHPNREFFAALQGIKWGDQGSFRRDQGIPLSSAIWHSLLVTNPIVPTNFQRCREGEKGAARYSKSRKPISSSTPAFVHVKGAPGMQKSLAELVDANDRRSGPYDSEMGRVARRPGAPSSPQTGTEGSQPFLLARRTCFFCSVLMAT